MYRYIYSTLMLVFFFSKVFSQEVSKSTRGWIFGPSVSYQYQNHSMLKVSFWGLTDLSYSEYLKLNATADIVWDAGKTFVIPELGVTYYLNNVAVWPYLKAELTPYTVSPKVGLSLFSLVDVGVGYGWSLQEKKDLGKIEGFNISLGVSVPLNFFF